MNFNRGKYLLPILLIVLFFSGAINLVKAGSKDFTISGYILNSGNQPISFANILHKESGKGAVADEYGKFELATGLAEVTCTLQISAIGYCPIEVSVDLTSDHTIHQNFHLKVNRYHIEQVVISGQSKPVPVDSSIYKIKLIDNEKIQQSGSVNLSELLTTEANIRMTTDLILGTQIEMMGLEGQNVKVMIDGVPIIGRLSGNIDLSQINLDNIEQVEIIEGPMSVVYGNNALAGSINLITKQNKYHKLETQTKVYAESVGRYSFNVSGSQRIDKNMFSVDGGYEYFGGVDFDKSNRSMNWKPKKLYKINANYKWDGKNWQPFIKGGIFKDRLWNKSDLSEGHLAKDTYYFTERYDISAGITGSWNKNNSLNIVASYNIYYRDNQDFSKDLSTLKTTMSQRERTQEMYQKMTRGIWGYQFSDLKLKLQCGYDINVEAMDGARIESGHEDISDYAAFLNLNYKVSNAFEIQPGIRVAYNSDYNAPLVYSINTKWSAKKKFSWRASGAKGFRAPDVKELYYNFKDSNHDIEGNPDLKAESSINFNSTLDYKIYGYNAMLNISCSQYYNSVDNLITLQSISNTTSYSYFNVDDSKSTGGDFNVDYSFKNKIKINMGYGLTGRCNTYGDASVDGKFKWTHEFFCGVKLVEPFTSLVFKADYKYNGELPYYYSDDNEVIQEGLQEAYQTLNASLKRNCLKGRLNIVAGAKNLFDVTSVMTSGSSSTAHSSGSDVPISYGRSYFISATFKFNK